MGPCPCQMKAIRFASDPLPVGFQGWMGSSVAGAMTSEPIPGLFRELEG